MPKTWTIMVCVRMEFLSASITGCSNKLFVAGMVIACVPTVRGTLGVRHTLSSIAINKPRSWVRSLWCERLIFLPCPARTKRSLMKVHTARSFGKQLLLRPCAC